MFYSHVNYSVTKIKEDIDLDDLKFYSHVNYSVTKIVFWLVKAKMRFTVT